MQSWKNFNSFLARLTTEYYSPWINLPIWALRQVLEEPWSGKAELECDLWVATEWILFAAPTYLEDIAQTEPYEERLARADAPGSLCPDFSVRGIHRVNFWATRLKYFHENAQELGLDNVMQDRLARALHELEKFQTNRKADLETHETGQ